MPACQQEGFFNWLFLSQVPTSIYKGFQGIPPAHLDLLGYTVVRNHTSQSRGETLNFKKGSTYTRDDIHTLYFRTPVPKTKLGHTGFAGNWTSGYARVKNELIVFMNINVPGTTGHDFPNSYDPETQTIEWFGKPNTNSKQQTFKKIFSGELVPHFLPDGIILIRLHILALAKSLTTLMDIQPYLVTVNLQQPSS
jgi:hypothetical protein